MTAYPTDQKITNILKLESGTLNFFSGASTSGGTFGDLCSVNDVDIGNKTFFPLSTNNRNSWLQYLREVKELSWSISYNFDDGSGTTETASESGTTVLMPQLYRFSSVPNPPGIEHRRRILGRELSSPGLTLKEDNGNGNLVIYDAVTETLPDGETNKKHLEITFVIFGDQQSSDSRRENVAHDPATGIYYPKFFILIETGFKTIGSFDSISDDQVGTVSVEDLGSCPIYGNIEGITCSFSATIATRFTDP